MTTTDKAEPKVTREEAEAAVTALIAASAWVGALEAEEGSDQEPPAVEVESALAEKSAARARLMRMLTGEAEPTDAKGGGR